MKYLIVLALVMLVVWQWRSARMQRIKTKTQKNAASQTTVDMVACAHCGVHLPGRDAIQGKAGAYCDAQHRAAAEH